MAEHFAHNKIVVGSNPANLNKKDLKGMLKNKVLLFKKFIKAFAWPFGKDPASLGQELKKG